MLGALLICWQIMIVRGAGAPAIIIWPVGCADSAASVGQPHRGGI